MQASYAFVSHLVLLSLVFFSLARALNKVSETQGLLLLVLIVASLLLLIPINGISVLWYLKGTLGSLSLMTTLVLASYLVKTKTQAECLSKRDKNLIYPATLMLAAALYATSYHPEWLDLYALGLDNQALMLSISGGVLLFWFTGRQRLAVFACIVVLGYRLNVMDSNNVWDYFIDPVLVGVAFFWLLRQVRGYFLKVQIKEHA